MIDTIGANLYIPLDARKLVQTLVAVYDGHEKKKKKSTKN